MPFHNPYCIAYKKKNKVNPLSIVSEGSLEKEKNIKAGKQQL
jgi:hypothetical protein